MPKATCGNDLRPVPAAQSGGASPASIRWRVPARLRDTPPMPAPPAPLPTGPLVTRDSLAAELGALGVESGETLLVHSSLSSLGWVCGGAVAVVQGLLDALGPGGTLVVPTQTGDLSDPALWNNPPVPEEWWPAIRAAMPAYDPRITPSHGVGVIPETVRTWPGALRSAHPPPSSRLRSSRGDPHPLSPPSARAPRRSPTGTPTTAASASAVRWPDWSGSAPACCCSASATPPARASTSPSTAYPPRWSGWAAPDPTAGRW
ncbi:hypothetical protein GCM10010389_62130 [Streptomyces echinoruber]|uniref:Aminoglycoside N(3)-acetyltransferase n=1 Tax=Streptomyces echinoruber TaxID=68898 RepID=A0A918VNE7_9ACTN|nr:hypothetical protein GCM10010389_62130 [Streptomyces echinoruber]